MVKGSAGGRRQVHTRGSSPCAGEQRSMCACGSVHTLLCPRARGSSECPSQDTNSKVLASAQLWNRPLGHVGLSAPHPGPSMCLPQDAVSITTLSSVSPGRQTGRPGAQRAQTTPKAEGRLPGVQEVCSLWVTQPTSPRRSVSVRLAGSIDSLCETFRKTATKSKGREQRAFSCLNYCKSNGSKSAW